MFCLFFTFASEVKYNIFNYNSESHTVDLTAGEFPKITPRYTCISVDKRAEYFSEQYVAEICVG